MLVPLTHQARSLSSGRAPRGPVGAWSLLSRGAGEELCVEPVVAPLPPRGGGCRAERGGGGCMAAHDGLWGGRGRVRMHVVSRGLDGRPLDLGGQRPPQVMRADRLGATDRNAGQRTAVS